MAVVYKDKDADISVLKGKKIAVLGYGSQGRNQALNLKDSGLDVIIGLHKASKSWKVAEGEGLKGYAVAEASKLADFIIMLIPDIKQPEVFKNEVAPNLTKGKIYGVSHGFNVHFNLIKLPKDVDVIMVAPKSPGIKVREEYMRGYGVPSIVAVSQDYSKSAWKYTLAWAKAIGSTRPGVVETTFKEETETDIFGEQTVLVGGIMELIKTGFEVLTERGYQPEIAYFEVCNELKLIMDLIHAGGLERMLKGVSDTAKYGGLAYGPKVIDDDAKRKMFAVLDNITSGAFAKEWMSNPEDSMKRLSALMEETAKHPIEKTGKQVRKLMGQEK